MQAEPNFESALAHTLRWEGGYAHDPADPGGETWRGISRRAHPHWEGWAVVDACKGRPEFPACLNEPRLNESVRRFYVAHYWVPLLAARWPSAAVAGAVFDAAVHGGLRTAVRRLQRCLNLLQCSPALLPDGAMGPLSLAALRGVLAREGGEAMLLHMLHALRVHALLAAAEAHPQRRRFVRGWLRRCISLLPAERIS